MDGTSKRRIGGVAIVGMVVAGVVGVTSLSVSGTSHPEASGPVLKPYGTLTINLTDGDPAETFTLDYTDPALGTFTETVQVEQPCAAILPGSGDLLTLEANPPANGLDRVQVRNFALGVNTGNTSCGSSSAAVISGAEQLKLALGPDLLDEDVYIASAVLKVTQNKKGNLTYALDDGAQGDEIAISRDAQRAPVDVDVVPVIATKSDLFRSITVASTSTKDNEGISIANGTTFNLVTLDPDFDVAVDCGEFVTVPGNSGDIATEATYERLDNKTDNVLCDEVGVRVQIQNEGDDALFDRVFWNNDTMGINNGETQTVQAYFTIVWAGTTDASRLDRDIDYDADESLPAEKMLWCDGFTTLGIPNLPTSTIDLDGDGTVDDLAPWCLVEDDRVLQADGTIVQTQKLFGSGDPWAR